MLKYPEGYAPSGWDLPKELIVLVVLKRIWVLLLVLAAALLGAVGVMQLRGMFGSDEIFAEPGKTEAIVSVNVKKVTYELFGPAEAVGKISYLDENGKSLDARFTSLPWTQTLTTTIPSIVAQVVAQGDADTIGCRITVNGVIKDEQTTKGHDAQTFCLVKAA
ncbi:transport acessory protein MmpS [Mycolicibacterium alvei]|nr:transport acessory protein MmpS [Mycolicibacterium alvei]